MKRHRLLTRQIKKHLGEVANRPELQAFLSAVNEAYEQADRDRTLLERSIDLSSEELSQRYQESQDQLHALTNTQAALQNSFSLLHASLNSIHEALLVITLDGDIELHNSNLLRIFELPAMPDGNVDKLLDTMLWQLDNPEPLRLAMQAAREQPEVEHEAEFKTSQGRFVEAYSSPRWLEQKLAGVVWSFRDVTELKLKEEEAKHRAYHDLLTGLPNRRLLSARLNQTLKQAQTSGEKTALLFIDLDGFKDVNDSLGHAIGDALLKEVAHRLESCLPENTLLSRHGGDEFIALMEHQEDSQQARKFSQAILEAFHHPFHLGDEDVYMSASIGIALAGKEGDANRLISHADMAMYQAKQQGKNTYEFYTPRNDSQSAHRLKIRNQLNVALEQEEFELFFQPKICLESGAIRGAEALIRWQPEPGEFRSPVEFIPIAEESGQIIPISQWVIKRCCEHLKSWSDFLQNDFVLALNISAKHFQRGLLQEDMANAIERIQVDPSKLELEVTETAIMDDVELAVSTLESLQALGIRTAIDDFGTGHSSLSYLRKLPIEILKIDKSFIDEILTSKEDRTLVKGIIDMVHALGIEVVAEGVENHQMAELLKKMGCDQVQGYHYCKPVPESDFIALLKSQQCYI
ncbi:MAG: EAL domain-containing protein [Oleiphilaceae bacterium]|nr:EAL domain-containing protein [Oleiphilaceae bacterium]